MTMKYESGAGGSSKHRLLAKYEKTIYQNDRDGFCIFKMVSEDDAIPQDARDKYVKDNKIHFSVKGYYLPAVSGVTLELNGSWEKSKFGLQFSVDSFTEVVPKTKSGIIAYLSSGLIKGIGRTTAELIVGKFGTKALDVMEHEPQRLLEIKGISEKRLQEVMDSYAGSRGLQELMTFLGVYGVTPNKVKKIQEQFGGRAAEVIKASPYRLCEISGFGFRTVDEIARNINFHPADPLRLEGGITFILEEALERGDLFLFREVLQERAYQLLSERVPEGSVSERMVQKSISKMCAEDTLYADAERIYLSQFLHFEEQTAKMAAKMLTQKKAEFPKLEKYLQKAQKDNDILLSEKQAEAVRMCMENNLSIITGGPGTGKTTVLKIILEVFEKLHPNREILLAAPTGRAARKMAESTGHSYAMTLHSALGLTSEDMDEEEETILSADFVIVDETSMVDMQLAYYLFRSLGTGTKLLFVGDTDQLPSIGAGNVLHELIASSLVPVTVLDMVFRQKDTSRIPLNAQSIRKGETKLLYGEDFQFLPAESAEEAAEIIQREFHANVKQYGLESTQVLTPFRQKSEAGANSLNQTLRELINPCMDKQQELAVGSRTIRYRDKVMQTRNMDEVSNGDIGFVSNVDKSGDFPVTVTYSDNRIKEYAAEDVGCVDLAYAMTIHKSQGSEYDCVIIPMLSAFYVMLQRALLYTAVTRAKKKVILVGQKCALFMAIHRNQAVQRNTALAERIRKEYGKAGAGKGKQAKKPNKEGMEQLTL